MTHTCESCAMPIESGAYCQYCTDDDGNLQDFDVRFERMVGWCMREDPAIDRAAAEQQTLAHMATMPAWTDHPRVRATGG